ncbi:MAG: efflux RND transporter periplasmic adaptor subunit [Candidatus Omnitrophota bacterium]
MAEKHKTVIPPRPVKTDTVTTKNVPVYLDSFGMLVPVNNVDIKSQVTGKVQEVNFEEGNEVSAGDLLFTIDPSQYNAELEKAEAALSKDLVDLKLKKDTLERNKQLFEKNLISQQDYEKYKTDVAVAEAKAQLDQANIDLAKINVEYCYIKAPVNGLTGKRQVDKGNIVSANTGPTLVNIKTVDTLYIDFTLPERNLPKVREAMVKELQVQINAEGDDRGPYSGELLLLDNTVDDSTGTFSLRAIIHNDKRFLWPGQFVRVRLILGIMEGAIIVPEMAVQLGQKGYYAFVVTDEGKADLRQLTAGEKYDGNVVIEKGVKPGEKIVTVGQMGLSPGVSVVDISDKNSNGNGPA